MENSEMTIQKLFITLLLSLALVSNGVMAADPQPKHCDIHKTDATHD
jgi:hypothetical protein